MSGDSERRFRRGNQRIAQLVVNPVIAEQVERVRAATAERDRVYVAAMAEIRKARRADTN